MSEQKPSIGRVVHYVLNEGRNAGEHRPAFVVKVWGDQPDSLVQLQVFTDSNPASDSNDCLPQVLWKTSVKLDADAAPGTWHWPERV